MIEILVWGFAGGCLFAVVILWLASGYYFRHNPTKPGDKYRHSFPIQLPKQSNDIIYYFDMAPKMHLSFTCPPLESILGEREGKKAYKRPGTLLSLIHPDDHKLFIDRLKDGRGLEEYFVFRLKINNEEYEWYEDYLTPVYEQGRLVALLGVLRNIDNRIKMEEMLNYRVAHDAMTGLHSREYFDELMERLDKRMQIPLTMAICDMDELKRANDDYGHKMGDKYIKAAAATLNRFSSDDVIISRIGGDEFAVMILNRTKEEGNELIKQICDAVADADPVIPGMPLSMSIGYKYTGQTLGRMDEVFELADSRMYKCKMGKKRDERLAEESSDRGGMPMELSAIPVTK